VSLFLVLTLLIGVFVFITLASYFDARVRLS